MAAWRGKAWRLHLTGGEPLLAPGFFELCGHAARLGIHTLATTAAGSLSAQTLPELTDCGLRQVWISLDGMRAETHDFSRGRPGVHATARRAVELLVGASEGPRVGVAAIVMGHNLAELAELARWCSGLRIPLLLHPLVRVGPGWRRLWPGDAEAAARAIEELRTLKAGGCPIENSEMELRLFQRYYRNPEACFPEADCASRRSLRVNPDGQCYLCDFGKPSVGDVRSAALRAIWDGEAARVRRAEIMRCKKSCLLNRCNFSEA